MAISQNSQIVLPSLSLNFASSRTLDPRITFNRDSIATYIDSSGVLQTAPANVARFDHNPTTGESLGLLVEEARTNGIRNNTMQGAVAGTPGTAPTNWFISSPTGITRSVVGTGTETGITYIDIRFNGTATAAGAIQVGFELANQASVAATVGQTFAQSLYWKLAAGSTANLTAQRLFNNEYSSASAYLRSNVLLTSFPTSAGLATQRVSFASTMQAATCAFVQPCLGADVANGAAIDITLRIGLPQLERGAFATSVIPTTTAAATRSADVVSITGANFSSWYRQDEGTIFAEATNRETYPGANVFPYLAQVDDGTNNNRVSLDFSVLASGYRYNLAVVSGGSTQFETGPFGITQSSARWAAGLRSSDFASAVSVSPGTLFTSTSGTLPGVMTQLRIGAGFGKAFSGTIRRLTYWPVRLPNATLQALTR